MSFLKEVLFEHGKPSAENYALKVGTMEQALVVIGPDGCGRFPTGKTKSFATSFAFLNNNLAKMGGICRELCLMRGSVRMDARG